MLLLLLLSCFSHVRLCATPETAAHQALLSLGFSRQEHWSGLPFPSPMHESEKYATPWTATHQASLSITNSWNLLKLMSIKSAVPSNHLILCCPLLLLPLIFPSSVQLLSRFQIFATLWTTARQASLSITNSWSLLKLMSIESVMPSNHIILCHPFLLPSSIFPSIRVFSNESVLHISWPKY